MKMRNKGKVHPTLPSTSSGDAVSILKLLPAAILALITVLSLEDRRVLAYMLTRSAQSASPSFVNARNGKKFLTSFHHRHHHKPPSFDCDCFDCYTWYWFKWDSSPNRELIHQAIEAFEEHAFSEEPARRPKNKKRERVGRRGFVEKSHAEMESESSPANDVATARVKGVESRNGSAAEIDNLVINAVARPYTAEKVMAITPAVSPASCDKGFARKVLPDVLGLLNSRLWDLLSPNV